MVRQFTMSEQQLCDQAQLLLKQCQEVLRTATTTSTLAGACPEPFVSSVGGIQSFSIQHSVGTLNEAIDMLSKSFSLLIDEPDKKTLESNLCDATDKLEVAKAENVKLTNQFLQERAKRMGLNRETNDRIVNLEESMSVQEATIEILNRQLAQEKAKHETYIESQSFLNKSELIQLKDDALSQAIKDSTVQLIKDATKMLTKDQSLREKASAFVAEVATGELQNLFKNISMTGGKGKMQEDTLSDANLLHNQGLNTDPDLMETKSVEKDPWTEGNWTPPSNHNAGSRDSRCADVWSSADWSSVDTNSVGFNAEDPYNDTNDFEANDDEPVAEW